MSRLKQIIFILLIFLLTSIGKLNAQLKCNEIYGKGQNRIYVATGSPGELGLLRVLAEEFAKDHNVSICWIKAGSGKVLKLLKEKAVDLILVHAPDAEKKAVAEGWATRRTLIASNKFYIVGPWDDPAKVAESQSVIEAYRRIAKAKAKFFSRGDNSGTHKKEMQI
ncbi:MAG: substrate-binding domain-containing protein [Thermodesulfobacterium sp.]|nr:substrate-binding domain-containing protein [Thermodesulfobacterium sp.]